MSRRGISDFSLVMTWDAFHESEMHFGWKSALPRNVPRLPALFSTHSTRAALFILLYTFNILFFMREWVGLCSIALDRILLWRGVDIKRKVKRGKFVVSISNSLCQSRKPLRCLSLSCSVSLPKMRRSLINSPVENVTNTNSCHFLLAGQMS